MLTMAVGHSDDVDPELAIAAAIEQCRATLGDQAPGAAILFVACDSFDPALIGAVRQAFPGIDVMGSTSAAEMSSVAGFQEDSIALAVFASDDVDIGAGIGIDIDDDPVGACRLALAQASARLTSAPKVCIVLTEGLNGQRVAEALRDALPPGVLLIGGAAGRHELDQSLPTYQFCNEQVATDGVAIMLLAGHVTYSTAVGTGWRVLGPRGVVTRSDYGVIHQIDGRPARDWVGDYLDVDSAGTAAGNPLAIQDAGSDNWYLRVVLAADESGGIRLPGGVPVGATVQLTTTTPDEMLRATADALERARAAFPADATPAAALVFSCAVRKYMLGSKTAREVAAARQLLPDSLPIAGMYCIGEIAPTGASRGAPSHFLNETFVTLLLGS